MPIKLSIMLNSAENL